MGLPRQSGKTTFICTHARPGDLIVNHNTPTADRLSKDFGVNISPIGSLMDTYRSSSHFGIRCDLTLGRVRRLWLDEYQLYGTHIPELIKHLGENNPNLVVIGFGT